MATEKTLITHSSEGNIGYKDQLGQWLFVANIITMTVAMTCAIVNIFTMATKKKLNNSLLPCLTKFIFGTGGGGAYMRVNNS